MGTAADFLETKDKGLLRGNGAAQLNSARGLLSIPELKNLLGFTYHFPHEVTSFYGYEIPLGTPGKGVDFLLCIHQPEPLLAWIRNNNRVFNPPAHSFFTGLQAIAEKWKNSSGYPLNNLWFEYDYSGICARNFLPNLFVGPKRTLHPWEVITTVEDIFLKTGHQLNSTAYGLLLDCFSILPQGSWISQVGSMVARQEQGLRVFIQDIPKGAIPAFLRKARYTGNTGTGLYHWINVANELAQKVELDIDLNLQMEKKLGLELYFSEMEDALIFLKRLQAENLCTPEKYLRLKDHLQSLSMYPVDSYHHFFSHFKIGFDGHRKFVAKAYLGFVTAEQMPHVCGAKPLIT